jgi:hypothetical protein
MAKRETEMEAMRRSVQRTIAQCHSYERNNLVLEDRLERLEKRLDLYRGWLLEAGGFTEAIELEEADD